MGFAPENFDTLDMFTKTPTTILDVNTLIMAEPQQFFIDFIKLYMVEGGCIMMQCTKMRWMLSPLPLRLFLIRLIWRFWRLAR
jgi:hypothetical protein